jgi:hypothetical protein
MVTHNPSTDMTSCTLVALYKCSKRDIYYRWLKIFFNKIVYIMVGRVVRSCKHADGVERRLDAST